MAATAAAAIGSSFSSSMRTLKCMRTKHFLSDNYNSVAMKLSAPRTFAPISQSYAIDHVNMGVITQSKWRVLKISAAVAQEEAAATAAGLVEEEVEEVEEDAETKAEDEAEAQAPAPAFTPLNTKLYFGNLPYNVDSAQLAGIIQEFGSPELVEVCDTYKVNL